MYLPTKLYISFDLLKIIISYNNIYLIKIPENSNEKKLCLIMSKNNEMRKNLWVNEFKNNLRKKIKDEESKKKINDIFKELINHIRFIYKNEIITLNNSKIVFINYNIMFFTIEISNYGKFVITIINNNNKIWIHNICEPENIVNKNYILNPNDYKDNENIIQSDYYFTRTFKAGNIKDIIDSIWYTPFWKKRMPYTENYIYIY
jgi:hypothetical protein